MARNRDAHRIRRFYNPSRLDLKRPDYTEPAKPILDEAFTSDSPQPSFAERVTYVLFGEARHLVPDLDQAIQDLDEGKPVILDIRKVMEHYAAGASKEAEQ